jgi:predicted nucleic acid-binding Zn ribbon protein
LARAALAAARARARRIEEGRAGRDRTGPAWTRRSGSRPDERDPQPLESTLARLLAEAGWEAPAAVGGIIHGWADIVGPRIAAHCEPVSFEDGVLTVQTDSPAWATELRHLSRELLNRLNASVPSKTGPGGRVVAAIDRIAVLGPNPPSWKRGRLNADGNGRRGG